MDHIGLYESNDRIKASKGLKGKQTMNQAHDNQFDRSPDEGGGFGSDIKNEFTDNLGGSEGAFGGLFKPGGFLGERKNQLIVGGLLIIMIALGVSFYLDNMLEEEDAFLSEEAGDSSPLGEEDMMSGDQEDTPKTDHDASKKDHTVAAPATDKHALKESAKAAPAASAPAQESHAAAMQQTKPAAAEKQPMISKQVPQEIPAPAQQQAPISQSFGPAVLPKLTAPEEQMKKKYDESADPFEFSWEGTSGTIAFSRSPDMKPALYSFRTKKNSFSYKKLPPGMWYWQVSNRAGNSAIRSFEVQPPDIRLISLVSPKDGSSIDGKAGVIAWMGDSKVAYYRVEMSNSDQWEKPNHRFATSGTQLTISEVPAGAYKLRVGAFSEVSGQWEYTAPVSITVAQ